MLRSHLSLATIPNRYAFIDKIAQCGDRHNQLSLMLIDVVRFSDVTTSFGIEVGDQFLLEIANRLLGLFNHDFEFAESWPDDAWTSRRDLSFAEGSNDVLEEVWVEKVHVDG